MLPALPPPASDDGPPRASKGRGDKPAAGSYRRNMRVVVHSLALVAASLALLAAPARASVCCMTTGLFGVGRLGLWEESAAGVRATGANTLGSWDAAGTWRDNPEGWLDGELRVDAYGLLRITDRAQVHVLFPYFENLRGVDDDLALAGGLGDVELGARWDLLSVGELEPWPAVGVTVSALLPSGVRPEDAEAPYGADATGRGAMGAAAALSVEESFGKAYARVDLGGTVYAPFRRADLGRSQLYGPTLAAAASAGGAVLDGLLLGVMAGLAHDRPLTLGDEEQADSVATAASAGLLASWSLDPHWTVLANVTSGIFLDALGQNRPGRVSASLGVRYAHF